MSRATDQICYLVNKDNEHALSAVQKILEAPSRAALVLLTKKEMAAFNSCDVTILRAKQGDE